MLSNVTMNVHNHFKAKLIDAKTGKVKKEYNAYNLVTDFWYEWLFTTTTTYSYPFEQLHIGTGGRQENSVQEPKVTDEYLFQIVANKAITWDRHELRPDGLVIRSGSVNFTESEANGELTEVGLSYRSDTKVNVTSNNYKIGTHALFKDSEDNVESISKTVSDRLVITITVYGRIDINGKLQSIWTRQNSQITSFSPSDAKRFTYIDNSFSLPPLFRLATGGNLVINWSNDDFYLIGTHYPIVRLNNSNLGYNGIATVSNKSKDWNGSVLCNKSTVLSSTSGNFDGSKEGLGNTYLIKSILTRHTNLYVSFPDYTLYPPKNLKFNLTATEENQTDFNFDIPELMLNQESYKVTVKVNGAEKKINEDFEWYGKNFKLNQAWISADNRYLIQAPEINAENAGYYCAQTPMFYSSPSCNNNNKNNEQDWIYDFQNPVKVNTLSIPASAITYNDSGLIITLYYSTDGTDWKEALSLPAADNDYSSEKIVTVQNNEGKDYIEARYWKLHFNRTIIKGNSEFTTPFVSARFDYVKPGLQFKNGLQLNDNVEVEAWCEYPIKNTDWLIEEIVAQLTFSKGTPSKEQLKQDQGEAI